jgi:hypothetical protein
MGILQRLDNAKRVWGVACPAVPPPPDETILTWLSVNIDDDIERVFLRIPRRIRNWDKKYGSVNSINVYKFVTASLSEIREQDRRNLSENFQLRRAKYLNGINSEGQMDSNSTRGSRE